MYDIIGDIHGHYSELKGLLAVLGYDDKGDHSRGRKVIFLGDFVDRGYKSREVVALARTMVESDRALAVMGNHEFNLIQYHTLGQDGKPLWPHSEKNHRVVVNTLASYEGFEAELKSDLEWFKTLPLYLELAELRVVHAAWAQKQIVYLQRHYGGNQVAGEFFVKAANENEPEFWVAEHLLKGIEIKLPTGIEFTDKDGNVRASARVKWWQTHAARTYAELGLGGNFPDEQIPGDLLVDIPSYPPEEKMVFFGHYWASQDEPYRSTNAVCLDYSVGKKGELAAYRFNGEKAFNAAHLVTVPSEYAS